MFYGKVIKENEVVVPEVKDGYSVIHLSRACLNNPEQDGKLYVQVEDKNGCYNICCLQKNVCEDTPLDIFLMIDNDVKIKTSGNGNEVHVVGYYEMSLGQENLDEEDDEFDEEDEYENEEIKELTKKNTLKNSKSLALNFLNKNKQGEVESDTDDETNSGSDDEEDGEEDDEDDEEDDDEDDDDEDDDDEDDDEDNDENDDEEDDDDEEEEEEEKGSKKKKNKGSDKEEGKKGSKKRKAIKRSLNNASNGTAKKNKVSTADEAEFEKKVVAHIKKVGKCRLADLGPLKNPENRSLKLGAFIKERNELFNFDASTQTVTLKK
ncbi:conserved protein, unknown function [Hepatocystis sp. ex Piliocolobus tephrosceles]|nr:conserved protein, unknown function [Hepatocystis sp. ex Piliocolobus tephrosceles]